MNGILELLDKISDKPLTIGLGVVLLLIVYILFKVCLGIAKKIFKDISETQKIWLTIIVIIIAIIIAFTIFALYLINCNS